MIAGFRTLHPLPVFMYYAAVMLLAMLLLHPVFLLTALVLLGLWNVTIRAGERMGRTFVIFMTVGIALFVLNPLFSHRGEHIWFYLWEQPITLESVCYGLTIALSTLCMLFAFQSYRQILTSDRFLYLFAALWPKGALMTLMTMRFVPLLDERLRMIADVQRTKGISLAYGTLRQRASAGMKLLLVLLTWSLEEALQTADAMKARGFGAGARSTYRRFGMRARDWRAVAAVALLLAVCLVGRVYGFGVLEIYPSLQAWWLRGWEWLEYGAFAGLVALPLFMEGREWLRWRLLK
ncbi:cobalt ABC transporter permease [Paenibacillus athensensis]|uniref:energy-coupling factor transporter transmembrane component T n=1 Tax=Paenibacillus athensensis TaxID=1967502 RepID=UPI00106FED7F|nr:energy-coupling factor transporter transmembrane component T [Paenibacillus athensensis]MCD1259876.1 cobalt ABC transporter permease [Paenibacillus athensensis]